MSNEERLEQIRKDSKFTQDENGNIIVQLKVSDYKWLVSESLRANQLQQENERLTKERDQYFDDKILWSAALKIKDQQLQQAQAKAEKYKEVLEWYAHPETYKRAGNGEYVIMMDKGWNAQQALEGDEIIGR
jgi:hypothetical protein